MVRNRRARTPDGTRLARRASYVLVAMALAVGSVLVAPPAYAAFFTVNSADDTDDGTCDVAHCSLREAINAANALGNADTINFSIGTGAQTITPLSNLPTVGNPVTIDGTTQPGFAGTPLIQLDGTNAGASGTGIWLNGPPASSSTVRGLVINNFLYQQILIDSPNNVVAGNYLGTNAAGTATSGGGGFATVRLRTGANANTIGGATAADRNIISGGASAVSVETGASNNMIRNNSIGIGAGGAALTSARGVVVQGAATGNEILSNVIGANATLGIDLGSNNVTANDAGDVDTGPNNLQNYPVLSTATTNGSDTTITGTFNSTPNSTFRVEFFSSATCDSSGFGEGETVLGNTAVVTDASGDATLNDTFPGLVVPAGHQITATAADLSTGDTSEFSACETVVPDGPVAPSAPTGVTAGAGDGQAEVRWIASDTNGGSAIDTYTIESTPDTASTPVVVNAPATSATVTGLTNNTAYTFTVTATNLDGESSGASDPTEESVTPEAGAPAPETVSQETPSGGSASTGATTTATDPTNTTINTPNTGLVSIGEGAMTGVHPTGGQYFGQQIDITAPDATASNPMTFTFVTDCSAVPADISTCGGGPAPAPPPAAPTPSPPGPASATIQVRDYFYSPKNASVRLGGRVTFDFRGPRRHSATDSRGVGPNGAPLVNTGSRPAGARVAYTPYASGIYAFRSTVSGDPASMNGTVSVPVQLSTTQASTQTPVRVTWASSRPSGYRFDVQVRFKPSSSANYGPWQYWRSNTTNLSGQYAGSAANGSGTYQFQARLENAGTNRSILWSAPAALAVSTPAPARPLLSSVHLFHETDASGNVEVPDCTGADGIVTPLPACIWSEEVLPDGDLRIKVYTTINGRWRVAR